MVKTPRHSKPKSEAITIDLDEKDVSTIDDTVADQDAPNEDASDGDALDNLADQDIEQNNTSENDDNANASDGQDTPDEITEQTKMPEKDPAPQKSGGGSVFAAGLLGAILALAGAGGAQWAGLLPVPSQNQGETSTEIEEKLAALEAKLSEINTSTNADATIDSGIELVSLTTRMDGLESLVQNDNESALSALNDLKIRVDQLTSKIINVEETIPEIGVDGQAISLPPDLSNEIAALTDVSQQQAAQISNLRSELGSAQQNDKISNEAAKLISDLQARMDAAEKALAEASSDVTIARALAATNVKNAINRGGTFSAELDAYAQIDPEHQALSQLGPIAEKGVLTRAELLAAFPGVANRMIASVRPQTADTNIMTRLLDSATSMVKVRKVGEVEGDTTEAIVARMETRLNAGNLNGAINQWETLPDAAKTASKSFVQQLKDRRTAEKFADQLMQASPAKSG